ncbi:F0F1 ATP synthase subunit delta [Nocardioides sp. SYSU DS0663]|uniref:F0F1 ATP synthase subunit delta n=1 Tax=Nocardioides sp. SYSU DS0663 TaxID=3416445 RepID=UPI003F4B94A4
MTSSFRGASADSVAGLVEELPQVVPSADSASTVADELFSVSQTVRAEGSLRRFATDVSVPAEAKAGLVRQVFGGKVSEATLTLVASAVGRRWTAGRDLADALEHLGVVSAVRAADDQAARLSDELFAFSQTVKDNPALRDALSDPARTLEDKAGLVRSLLEGKAHPATVVLAIQSLAGTHRTVGVALAEYQKVAAEAHGRGVATVRVARELSDDERGRLAGALSRQYGRPVHLNLLVEPALLGGMRVEIGDDVIDGTVSGRLDDARRRLAG